MTKFVKNKVNRHQ